MLSVKESEKKTAEEWINKRCSIIMSAKLLRIAYPSVAPDQFPGVSLIIINLHELIAIIERLNMNPHCQSTHLTDIVPDRLHNRQQTHSYGIAFVTNQSPILRTLNDN